MELVWGVDRDVLTALLLVEFDFVCCDISPSFLRSPNLSLFSMNVFDHWINLVPRVLATLVQRRNGQHCWRTSGRKRSAMTGFLDFRFYCARVRLHVSTNGNQDSWTSGVTAQVRRITLSQRSLLPVPPLDKVNEDSENEIARLNSTFVKCAQDKLLFVIAAKVLDKMGLTSFPERAKLLHRGSLKKYWNHLTCKLVNV